jgi:hypothetical protein
LPSSRVKFSSRSTFSSVQKKATVDQAKLSLQALLYEKAHLMKEIDRYRDFVYVFFLLYFKSQLFSSFLFRCRPTQKDIELKPEHEFLRNSICSSSSSQLFPSSYWLSCPFQTKPSMKTSISCILQGWTTSFSSDNSLFLFCLDPSYLWFLFLTLTSFSFSFFFFFCIQACHQRERVRVATRRSQG